MLLIHESLQCLNYLFLLLKDSKNGRNTCCHVLRRTRRVAAPGLAERINRDIIAGVALEIRQGAGGGGVVAEHRAAPADRSGLVHFSTADRSPGDPHGVARHHRRPEVAGATRCWEQTRQTGTRR